MDDVGDEFALDGRMPPGVTAVASRVDRLTQRWVQATGRPVDLAELAWLDGPWGGVSAVGSGWVSREADRLGASLRSDGVQGLFADMSVLDGDGFRSAELRSEVVDFYEQTSSYTMTVTSQWSRLARPFGWIIARVFSRRLDQLNLPTGRDGAAEVMDSRILSATSEDGRRVGAAWLRSMRRDGETAYGGWYSVANLPGRRQPHVRVVFPLPNGHLAVLLRPEVAPNGGLRLLSPLGGFGDPGAYLVVRAPLQEKGWARRIPLAEQFDVFVDPKAQLRTVHGLWLSRRPVVRLDYRLERVQGAGEDAQATG